jgi:hypothetical protein
MVNAPAKKSRTADEPAAYDQVVLWQPDRKALSGGAATKRTQSNPIKANEKPH